MSLRRSFVVRPQHNERCFNRKRVATIKGNTASSTDECVCSLRRIAFRLSVRLMGAPHVFNILPASLSIPSLTEMVSVTAPCHKHIPPTGTVRRGVSWSRFRNKTACSATKRTTLNAILCCLSFSYSDNLASSHPSSPKEPDR